MSKSFGFGLSAAGYSDIDACGNKTYLSRGGQLVCTGCFSGWLVDVA